MRPDPEMIRSLVDFLEKEGLEELYYEAGGARIRVQKRPTAASAAPVHVVPLQTQAVPLAKVEKPKPQPAAKPAEKRGRDLNSPMAGIFYRAPSPGAEPIVVVGDEIEPGQTVGLIEAMKTFNEVTAEFAGKVLEFYVQDSEGVREGQPILCLAPSEVEA